MKKSTLALALVLGVFLISSCATMDRLAVEQEEEMRQAVAGVNSRWEPASWDIDYLSE